MPEFNATAAKGNGWDGLGKKHHLISRYEATTSITLQGTKYNGNLVLDDFVAFIEMPQREKKVKKKKKTKKPV